MCFSVGSRRRSALYPLDRLHIHGVKVVSRFTIWRAVGLEAQADREQAASEKVDTSLADDLLLRKLFSSLADSFDQEQTRRE